MEFKKFSTKSAAFDVTKLDGDQGSNMINTGPGQKEFEPLDFASNPHGLVFKN